MLLLVLFYTTTAVTDTMTRDVYLECIGGVVTENNVMTLTKVQKRFEDELFGACCYSR